MVVWPGYCACCQSPNPTRKTTLHAPKQDDVSQNVPLCEACARHVPREVSSALVGILGVLALILSFYLLFRYAGGWADSLERMFGLSDSVWLVGIIPLYAGLVFGAFYLVLMIWSRAEERKRHRYLRPECLPGDDPVAYVGYRAGDGAQPPAHRFRFLVPPRGPAYADLFVDANAAEGTGSRLQSMGLLARRLASDDIVVREEAVQSAVRLAQEGNRLGLEAIEAAIRLLHQGPLIEFHSPGIITGKAEDLLVRDTAAAEERLRELAANDTLWETSPAEVQRLLSLATTIKDPVELLERIQAAFGDRQTKAIQLCWAAMSTRAILAR